LDTKKTSSLIGFVNKPSVFRFSDPKILENEVIEMMAAELKPRDEKDKGKRSFWESSDKDSEIQITAGWAAKDRTPKSLDYLLLPKEFFEELALIIEETPGDIFFECMIPLHREVKLSDEDLRKSLAGKIFKHRNRQIFKRITEGSIKTQIKNVYHECLEVNPDLDITPLSDKMKILIFS